MSSCFLDLLKKRVLVFDGAMGTSIQTMNLTAEDFGGPSLEGCNEYLVFSKPEAIEKVHSDFLEAGADVIETDTFGSSSIVLAEYDIAHLAYELNVKAAQLAKKVATHYSTPEKPRFVAGSIGPTTKLPTLGHIHYDDMKASYAEQIRGLVDGGIDIVMIETCQDVLQIKAALGATEEVFQEKGIRLPVIVSVTMEIQGTMLVGSEIGAVLTILEPFPIDVLGLNCATGPDKMTEHIRYLSENSRFAISCIPNAGIPENVGGHAHYHLTPQEMQTHLKHFVEDLGVTVVGGCCGTRPDHIQALVDIVQDYTPKPRPIQVVPSAASIYSTQPYDQDNSFLIIGERVNASGSKKCRDLLNAEDWDGLVSLARAQVREGCHILDVNVDYVGRDGEKDMHELVSRLVTNVTLPLMLDSTEWQKMEAGLKVAGGKCLLNSTNYEDGEPRFFKVLEIAKTYGAGVVVGTIDEEGMARVSDKKFAIAQRAYRQAVEFGIPAYDIFFDPLALPISTGIEEDRHNALGSLKAIKRIKEELPGCRTTIGVSNISFGLNPAARVVLNSVFLHLAREAGLDSAIVSASKILPMARIEEHHQKVAKQLIYDERKFEGDICVYDPLTVFTELFMGVTTKQSKETIQNLTLEEHLRRHIIEGERIGLEDKLREALEKYPPLAIINEHLLDGMKVVGEQFASGQMQLPFVLQSAETMKSAVAYLEQFMEKQDGSTKGKVLIATVKGDVHDIGKNLVDIILTNNGYTVYNLGIKQSVDAILEAQDKYQADCIAMSGLLVKSTAFMKENLQTFSQKGISVPVILGGAALTRKFVEKDCQQVYSGKVVYGRDAFTDLNFMDALMEHKHQGTWTNTEGFLTDAVNPEFAHLVVGNDAAQQTTEQSAETEHTLQSVKSQARPKVAKVRQSVSLDVPRPQPPFWGTKVLEDLDLEEVFRYLDLNALVAGQWQFRKTKAQSREEYEALVSEKMYPILEQWKAKIIQDQALAPQVVYGYFPCWAEENTVHVYTLESATRFQETGNPLDLVIAQSFEFPRQAGEDHQCLSDFFLPVGSEQLDVFPMQAVTVGNVATEYAQKLFKADNYSDYLYYYGLSVQTAEAVADWTHARIRHELGIGAQDSPEMRRLINQGYQGSRYSFGYPACPDLEDQAKQLTLLQAEEAIGLRMDESLQLHPEQSTTALVIYHPEARYFSA